MAILADTPLTILCPACHAPAARVDALSSGQSETMPRIDIYQCERGCVGGKLAVLFEVDAAHVPPEPGLVEREIARRGAFFPSDFTRSGGRDW